MFKLYALGFASGGLSLLAPCVLPLLPLIVSSSLRSSKYGPVLNAIGLTLSFTFVGILTTTFSQFFSAELIKNIGALILIVAGLVFIVPQFKNLSSSMAVKLSSVGVKLQGKLKRNKATSELLGGAVLGLIWSPCTGPTLAFAIGLASQAESLLSASLIFALFGLGAGLGLVSLGYLLRRFGIVKIYLLKFGNVANFATGILSIAMGTIILLGLDLYIQDAILDLMPSWLIKVSNGF